MLSAWRRLLVTRVARQRFQPQFLCGFQARVAADDGVLLIQQEGNLHAEGLHGAGDDFYRAFVVARVVLIRHDVRKRQGDDFHASMINEKPTPLKGAGSGLNRVLCGVGVPLCVGGACFTLRALVAVENAKPHANVHGVHHRGGKGGVIQLQFLQLVAEACPRPTLALGAVKELVERLRPLGGGGGTLCHSAVKPELVDAAWHYLAGIDGLQAMFCVLFVHSIYTPKRIEIWLLFWVALIISSSRLLGAIVCVFVLSVKILV